jgi:shikimate dehydrogenase
MTGMLGHPVAENPIDRMFDAVYVHYGLPWHFWKNDIASEADLALAVKALQGRGDPAAWCGWWWRACHRCR